MYIEIEKKLKKVERVLKKEDERLKQEMERYEYIKRICELKSSVYKKLDIEVYEDIEEYACKLYIFFNSIAKVTRYMVDKGIKIQSLTTKKEVKVSAKHIMKILREIEEDERNEYKRLARIQYEENYKRNENLIMSDSY
ncbi:MAG: hypothetical protein ACRCX7_14765 [Cetobacterium sp.]|uniref:hypothetical protein n=1 Tax=Cetobacterium sp. TaxID=2071632 RepID=UPI003F2C175D